MSLTALAIALSIAASPVAAAAGISALQWEKRVLVIFADTRLPAYCEQIRHLKSALAGLDERDLVVLTVSGDSVETVFGEAPHINATSIRRSLGADGSAFEVVLVGKDGAAKLRRTLPISVAELFATIDAMPMRANEMVRRQ